MNTVPLGPSGQPTLQSDDDHWYGLIRHPVPGVEVLPVMRSGVLGGFTPIPDVARSFALARINVSETHKNWEKSRSEDWWKEPNDYLADKLDEINSAYKAFENEINALPSPSLGSLLAHSIQIACRVGQECLHRGWATPMDVRMAWSTVPLLRDAQGRDAQQLLTWLTHNVTAAWADSLHQVPETTYDPHTGEVALDGRSLDRFELLAGIHTVMIGIEAIALAALKTDEHHILNCLVHPND